MIRVNLIFLLWRHLTLIKILILPLSHFEFYNDAKYCYLNQLHIGRKEISIKIYRVEFIERTCTIER